MLTKHLAILCVLPVLALAILGSAPRQTSGHTPVASSCLPGPTYNPACDVNHDGAIDINDIQLTAGHWRQTGTYTTSSWDLLGNAGTNPATNFLGTTDYVGLTVAVNGVAALRVLPATHDSYGYSPNMISGYSGNHAAFDAVGGVVGGGGSATPLCGPNSDLPCINQANSNFATVSGGYGNSASGSNAAVSGGASNQASGDYSIVGGGDHNVAGHVAAIGGGKNNNADSPYATIGGGEQNTTGGMWATIGGGQHNAATHFWATVGGGYSNTAGAASTTVSGGAHNNAGGQDATVGGGTYNEAIGSAATVAGGAGNYVDGSYATAGGGYNNLVSGNTAAVGGGYQNNASGFWAMIGGGYTNVASDTYAVVGGGHNNTAGGASATIGGGYNNTVNGDAATVAGGAYNAANGRYSFAAGYHAKASHDGTFVWADSTNADYVSTAPNQFLIRASGGVGIGTTAPQSTLQVTGNYIQFPTIAGAPPAADCDTEAEAGRVVVRTDGPPDLYICRGATGWVEK